MKSYKLEKILNIYKNRINKACGGVPCICIHGKSGTGKTALIDEFCDNLLKSGANVYFSIEKNVHNNTSAKVAKKDSAFRELIRQLVRMYGENQNSDFLNFIDSYVKGTLADDIENNLVKPHEKDSLIKFIYNCIKTEPLVFIVDDLDKADSFTIELIGNLITIDAVQFIAFSHTDDLDNASLTDMLYKNTKNIEYVELIDSSAIIGDTERVILPDESMLVLNKPGNESQYIKHYINQAKILYAQLAYDDAYDCLTNAYNTFLRVKDFLTIEEDDILVNIGDVLYKSKKYEAASEYFCKALLVTSEINDKRVNVYIKLANCYNNLGKIEKYREYVLLAEAFFSTPENRARYSNLYKKHIPNYLSLLSEVDEKIIFREKLKQAYIVCTPDDYEFTCMLYCEEAYMNMETSDFTGALKLLLDAQKIAEQHNLNELWDDMANLLALCYEQIDKIDESKTLWNKIIEKSHNPGRTAEAMINLTLVDYSLNGNIDTAADNIKNSIDLCTLAGETQTIENILNNIDNTTLGSIITR